MSHPDDLALVTACREELELSIFPSTRKVGYAALSLIEDTLNRHAPRGELSTQCSYCISILHEHYGEWIHAKYPCDDNKDALAALHTIADALGVNN